MVSPQRPPRAPRIPSSRIIGPRLLGPQKETASTFGGRIESENKRSQRRARLIHHVPRPKSQAHRRVRNLAGKLHFGLVGGDCGSARRGGFGKEKGGVRDQSLRVFFIDDMSGRNFVFALFHLKKRVVLEKLFVMLLERGHVFYAKDNLILALRLIRIFVNIHFLAVQNGLASRGSSHHARRLPVNLDVHLLHVLATANPSCRRWARSRRLSSDATATPLLGCNVPLGSGTPRALYRTYPNPR